MDDPQKPSGCHLDPYTKDVYFNSNENGLNSGHEGLEKICNCGLLRNLMLLIQSL